MEKDCFFLSDPISIKISLTNICNYKCMMCYNPSLREQRGVMTSDLFFSIVDQCHRNNIKKISIGATGEPLIHGKFLEFLKYAKIKGLRVSTVSNCSFLTNELSDEIIKNKIDKFGISIYSSSPEEHKQYTGSNCFHTVVENVTYFLEKWASSGKKIKVIMWFLPLPGVNSFEKYMQFWGPLAERVGLDISPKEQINWGGRVNLFKFDRFSIEKENGKMYFAWKSKTRCNHVRNYLHVLHNGDIVPCCVIPEVGDNKEIKFGNALEDRLIDVWRGNGYLDFKGDVFKKDYSHYRPCLRCSRIYEEKKIALTFEDLPGRVMKLIGR